MLLRDAEDKTALDYLKYPKIKVSFVKVKECLHSPVSPYLV